jgi:hypothetical protein
MNWLKWLFTSKYKKALKNFETQYKNKGGLWIETDNYTFRLDFDTMKIELVMEAEPND